MAYDKTIAIDFDGVIHKYSKGYKDGKIYDEPVEGTKEALQKFRDLGYKITINTARITEHLSVNSTKINWKAYHALVDWLEKYEIPFDSIVPKCNALHYIDDRGIRFNRESYSWEETLNFIEQNS